MGLPICINTLSHAQQHVSSAFSSSKIEMAERFVIGTWTRLETGAPVLDLVIDSLYCVFYRILEVGSHSVVFCAIQAIRLGDPGEALMYFSRAYHRLGTPA